MKKGDLVLCEFEWNDLIRYQLQLESVTLPEVDQIYTVRHVLDIHGIKFITLEEVPNPINKGNNVEMHFPVTFFHPLEIPDLEIDLNHKIANPKPYNYL